MGLFDRRKPVTYEVGDVVDILRSGDKKEADKLLKEIKDGKVPSISPKEQKKMEKIFKRASQGERGLGAALTSLKEIASESGSKNFKHVPVQQRYHPSRVRDLQKQGKLGIPGYSTADALKMKETDPKMYEAILQREAKRQGLI